ncbi:MAG: hypothetical protein DRJ10_03695 [Bacteroidetes bacterium]|nr:MAG: hypothetical protein DRJ10_03695 [Bacteroidota bacterium]
MKRKQINLKKDISSTLKTRHKKSRNYGNAANQFLFPLGNDNANVIHIVDITNISVNNNTVILKDNPFINGLSAAFTNLTERKFPIRDTDLIIKVRDNILGYTAVHLDTPQYLHFISSYTKNKAFDKQYYLDLIVKSIKQHGSLNRKDINDLLWVKLPDWMSDKQRMNKIGNLISELRINKEIENIGVPKKPNWVLLKKKV